jgi:hypothetical protein
MEEDRFMDSGDKDLGEDRDRGSGRQKPEADLLRRSLASAASAEEVCPDPEILAAYAEHSLDDEETARYELHFSQCARCRDMLAAMVRGEQPESVAGEKRERASGTAWIWDWRWFAPAAAAIVLAAVWFARGPMLNHPTTQQPQTLIASSQAPEASPPLSAAQPANVANAPAGVAPSSAGALDRVAPNLDSAKSEIAPPAKTAPQAGDDLKKFASNAPPNARNDIQAEKMSPTNGMPKAEASNQTRSNSVLAAPTSGEYVCPRGVICDGGIPKAGNSPPEATSAPVAREHPTTPATIPPDISAGNSTSAGAGRGNGVGNSIGAGVGGAAPAPRAAPEAVQAQSMSAAVMSSRPRSTNEMVTVESADDRNPRTLVLSPDPRVLWRISNGHWVEKSKDAGATWKVQWTSANAQVVAGAAPSVDTCWLVGRGAIILVTSDGQKWKTITPPVDADFTQVQAADASSATITTTDNRKFTTTDGGKLWTPAP